MGKWTSKPGPALARIKLAIKEADTLQSKVGWFESSHYPDGTPVAYVAAIQEFTERSFMRTTYDERGAQWVQAAEKGAASVARGERTVRQVFELLGLMAEGDIRRKITQIYEPPLAEATIRARAKRAGVPFAQASTKPLVDTGLMLATLTSVVVEGNKK